VVKTPDNRETQPQPLCDASTPAYYSTSGPYYALRILLAVFAAATGGQVKALEGSGGQPPQDCPDQQHAAGFKHVCKAGKRSAAALTAAAGPAAVDMGHLSFEPAGEPGPEQPAKKQQKTQRQTQPSNKGALQGLLHAAPVAAGSADVAQARMGAQISPAAGCAPAPAAVGAQQVQQQAAKLQQRPRVRHKPARASTAPAANQRKAQDSFRGQPQLQGSTAEQRSRGCTKGVGMAQECQQQQQQRQQEDEQEEPVLAGVGLAAGATTQLAVETFDRDPESLLALVQDLEQQLQQQQQWQLEGSSQQQQQQQRPSEQLPSAHDQEDDVLVRWQQLQEALQPAPPDAAAHDAVGAASMAAGGGLSEHAGGAATAAAVPALQPAAAAAAAAAVPASPNNSATQVEDLFAMVQGLDQQLEDLQQLQQDFVQQQEQQEQAQAAAAMASVLMGHGDLGAAAPPCQSAFEALVAAAAASEQADAAEAAAAGPAVAVPASKPAGSANIRKRSRRVAANTQATAAKKRRGVKAADADAEDAAAAPAAGALDKDDAIAAAPNSLAECETQQQAAPVAGQGAFNGSNRSSGQETEGVSKQKRARQVGPERALRNRRAAALSYQRKKDESLQQETYWATLKVRGCE